MPDTMDSPSPCTSSAKDLILGSTGWALCVDDKGIGSRHHAMDQNCHAQVQEVQANLLHGEEGRLAVLGGPHTLHACTTYCLACMHLEWPSLSRCCWCKRLFRSTPIDHRLRQWILCGSKHLALPIPSHHCFNLVARYAVLSTKEDISSAFDLSVVKGSSMTHSMSTLSYC